MKRGMAICLALLGILSHSVAGSQPSLLPFDRGWTVAQVCDLLAAGADVNARDCYGWTPLMWAVRRGASPEVIDALVRADADVNVKSKDGRAPLVWATAHAWNPATFRVLVEAGADVNARDRYGRTALMWAAGYGWNPEAFAALMAAGADVNAIDDYGGTSLMKAVQFSTDGDPAAVKALLGAGADMYAGGKGSFVQLMSAAFPKRDTLLGVLLSSLADWGARRGVPTTPFMEVAKRIDDSRLFDILLSRDSFWLLLEAEMDVNAADMGIGYTPLMTTVSRGCAPEFVDVLIAAGADVNARSTSGDTVLMKALGSALNSLENVMLLLKAGADPNAVGNESETVLVKAIRRGSEPEVIRALAAAGADVNAEDRYSYQTVLGIAAQCSTDPDVVRALVEAGADVNGKGKRGASPLTNAARHNENAEIVRTLVELGAEIGTAPLFAAARSSKNPDVIKALVAAGADVNAENKDGTAVLTEAAAYNKNPDIHRALIESGAKLDGRVLRAAAIANQNPEVVRTLINAGLGSGIDTGEITRALLRAAQNCKNPAVVSVLITAGADVEARDECDCTPLMLAAMSREHLVEVVGILAEAGADVNAKGKEGRTPLMMLREGPGAVGTLVTAGADVNARDSSGMTPLMWAASQAKDPKIIDALLAAGADAGLRSSEGKTAFDYSERNPEVRVAREVLRRLAFPIALTATAVSSGEVELAWTHTQATNVGEVGFRVQRKDPGGDWRDICELRDEPVACSDSVKWIDCEVTPDKKYEYRVYGFDKENATPAGGRTSNIAAVTVLAIPSNLRVFRANDAGVVLHWSYVHRSNSGFKVERSTGADADYEPIAVVKGVRSSYEHTFGAQPGVTYYYRVRAYHEGDSSAEWDDHHSGYSDVVQVTLSDSASGRVVDADGAGVRGVVVSAWDVDSGLLLAEAESSSDGTWRMLIAEGVTADVLPFKQGFVFNPEERRVQVPTEHLRFVGRPTVAESSALKQMSCSGAGILAARVDGTVWELGVHSRGPRQLMRFRGIMAVAAAPYHCLALKSDGAVWSWGSNNMGQTGCAKGYTAHDVPMQIAGLDGIVAVAAGSDHSMALSSDGIVWAWGSNGSGQLGNSATWSSPVPTQVHGLADVAAISCGSAYSMALKKDGTVWTWGSNSYGQLGDGTLKRRSTPVQVAGLDGVTSIAASGSSSMALKHDGTIWAWGLNDRGQLGDGSRTNRPRPVQVIGIDDVVSIAAGWSHSLATRRDSTVWAWGWNNYGQLGNGTREDSNVPVQIVGLRAVSALECGGQCSAALTPDGALWRWGLVGSGVAGPKDDTTVPMHIPLF